MKAPELEFQRAMLDAGIVSLEPPVGDGQLHRLYVEGDRPRTRNGWYVLFKDGIPAGAFGSWKDGVLHKWCARCLKTMTEVELAAQRQHMEQAKAARERAQKEAHEKARERAKKIWSDATHAPDTHPYLVGKNVKAFGIRVVDCQLVIPLRDLEGTIHSLQFINDDGEKRFLTDGAVNGHYYLIGEPTESFYICEGYATGATIHEATQCSVVVAFNAGNLLPVSEAIRSKYPQHQLVIAADNDQWSTTNAGLTNATKAAEPVNARVVTPEFTDTGTNATDFNDLHRLEGLDTVREQLTGAGKMTISARCSTPAGEIVQELARLSPIEYDRRREPEAKKLGIRVTTLDDEVKKTKITGTESNDQGQQLQFEDPEPWPEPVDGARLLDDLRDYYNRYVVLPDKADDAISLWTVNTHAYEVFDVVPMISIESPQMRCGKTTLMAAIGKVTRRSVIASNISPSAVFRTIEKWKPTLLLDETATFLKDNEEMRGVLFVDDGGVIQRVDAEEQVSASELNNHKVVDLDGSGSSN